jgi:hypothetical protein
MSHNTVGVILFIFIVLVGLSLGIDGGEFNGNH